MLSHKTSLIWTATLWLAMTSLGFAAAPATTRPEEGIALAIVYDTSGSMQETVPAADGGRAPKYVIANRALNNIIGRLEAVSAQNPQRKLQAGLWVFDNQNVRSAVAFGPLDAAALRRWVSRFQSPTGSTPLGNGLQTAVRAVLRSPLAKKHVLVLTDGQNTAGPDPGTVFPTVKAEAARQGSSVGVHFVAFDVAASVFAPLKKQGATVVGASDEAQLGKQLEFILEKKILLEEEEPPKQPAPPESGVQATIN